MEVIITVLLSALGFILYLLNKSRDEILQLKEQLHERDIQIIKLQTLLRDKNTDVCETPHNEIQIKTPVIDQNTFVRVIFKKNDKKYYDYLLGDVNDVFVGDFVEVYASNKFEDEPSSQLFIAQIIYISEPGEVSEYAKSKIKRKSDRKKW